LTGGTLRVIIAHTSKENKHGLASIVRDDSVPFHLRHGYFQAWAEEGGQGW
jgi:hypothetical protein